MISSEHVSHYLHVEYIFVIRFFDGLQLKVESVYGENLRVVVRLLEHKPNQLNLQTII